MLAYLQGLKFGVRLRVLRTARKSHVRYKSHSLARCALPRMASEKVQIYAIDRSPFTYKTPSNAAFKTVFVPQNTPL